MISIIRATPSAKAEPSRARPLLLLLLLPTPLVPGGLPLAEVILEAQRGESEGFLGRGAGSSSPEGSGRESQQDSAASRSSRALRGGGKFRKRQQNPKSLSRRGKQSVSTQSWRICSRMERPRAPQCPRHGSGFPPRGRPVQELRCS